MILWGKWCHYAHLTDVKRAGASHSCTACNRVRIGPLLWVWTHKAVHLSKLRAPLVAQLVKNPPAVRETQVWFLGWQVLLGKGQVTQPSALGVPWWLSWWRTCLQCGRPGLDPWVGMIPWRRERLLTPAFWPGESHGRYSPWGCKESDTTERRSLPSLWGSPAPEHRIERQWCWDPACFQLCSHLKTGH